MKKHGSSRENRAPLHIRNSSLNEEPLAGSLEKHAMYLCVGEGLKNFGKRRPGANSHLDKNLLFVLSEEIQGKRMIINKL